MLGLLLNNELDKTRKAVEMACFIRPPLTRWGRDYAGQTSLRVLPILGRDLNHGLPKCQLFPVLCLFLSRQHPVSSHSSYVPTEWHYHMLHVYNCILLKMSIWGSKHIEEY